ncbi:MAG: TonB-dependent receptor [Gammaproteobacteria bacterium]|nr:TonB-dependent receptor [Gammaproteobacteria bacterium]
MTAKSPAAAAAVPFLSLLLTGVALSGSAHAASELAEVVVTATRTRTPLTELAVPVIVIERATIENALALDAADLIAALPGVEVARVGGPGQPATIFMRGTDSNHTAVLIDGVRINPGTIGGAALQNLLPESIERIEIVKGARSTLYGTDAIGGVINVITRAGAARGAAGFAATGRYGTNVFAADAGATLGEVVDLGGSISWQNSNGYAPLLSHDQRRGYHNRSGNFSATWHAGEALSLAARAWQATGVSEYTGYDSSFSLAPLSQDFRTAAYALTAGWDAPAGVDARATLSRAVDRIDQNQADDYAHTRRDSLDLQLDVPLGEHQLLTAGTLLARERAAALSFGTLLDERTDTALVYLQDQLRFGAGEVLLATGYNHHETFGSRWTWNAEASYLLGAGLRLLAATGSAFHAPDSTDRFGWGGNPDLEPEFAREYALGLAWQGAGQSARIDAYENRIDDLIEYVLIDPNTFTYQTQNVGRARIRGLELGYTLTVGAWHVAASSTWSDPRNLSTASTLPRRARHTDALEVRYDSHAVELLAALRRSGPRLDVDDFGLPARNAGYALLALGARWRITPAWSLQLRLDNALDRDYALVHGYRTAGRSLSVATRYQLR